MLVLKVLTDCSFLELDNIDAPCVDVMKELFFCGEQVVLFYLFGAIPYLLNTFIGQGSN